LPETPRKTKRKTAKVKTAKVKTVKVKTVKVKTVKVKTVKVKTVKVKTVFGFMQGEGKIVGDIVSPLFPEDNWDSER
jgi:ABC-type phosphate/phosphonate transport system permease subunit